MPCNNSFWFAGNRIWRPLELLLQPRCSQPPIRLRLPAFQRLKVVNPQFQENNLLLPEKLGLAQ